MCHPCLFPGQKRNISLWFWKVKHERHHFAHACQMDALVMRQCPDCCCCLGFILIRFVCTFPALPKQNEIFKIMKSVVCDVSVYLFQHQACLWCCSRFLKRSYWTDWWCLEVLGWWTHCAILMLGDAVQCPSIPCRCTWSHHLLYHHRNNDECINLSFKCYPSL